MDVPIRVLLRLSMWDCGMWNFPLISCFQLTNECARKLCLAVVVAFDCVDGPRLVLSLSRMMSDCTPHKVSLFSLFVGSVVRERLWRTEQIYEFPILSQKLGGLSGRTCIRGVLIHFSFFFLTHNSHLFLMESSCFQAFC